MEQISFFVSVISLAIAVIAIYLQLKDRPKVSIKSIIPQLFSFQEEGSSVWGHKLEYIDVTIENTGGRPVHNLKAFAAFPGLDSLPLHPIIEGTVQKHTQTFDMLPNSKIKLWGSWDDNPVLNFEEATVSMSDFVNNGAPMSVVVSNENMRKTKRLSKKSIVQYFQKHSEALYS